MKNHTKNKIFSLFLAVITLISALHINNFAAFAHTDVSVTVFCGDKEVTAFNLLEDDEQLLTAKIDGAKAKSYRWQILFAGTENTFVSISDRTENTCKVNYALIKSNVNSQGKAYLRCVVATDSQQYNSEPIEITVSYNDSESKATKTAKTSAKAAAASKLRSVRAAENTYNVEIKYLYENGEEAWTSEKFNIQSGTTLVTEFPLPLVVGYKASFKEIDNTDERLFIDEEGENLLINLQNVSEDKIYKVIYEAQDTPYKVVHHLQSLETNGYNITITENFKGKTGTQTVGDNGMNMLHKVGSYTGSEKPENYDERFKGFSYLAYTSLTIAADGQTTVDIYYNRNYYIVDYVYQDGGYGVEAIAVRYGTQVFAKNPTRPGYNFNGWQLVGVGEIAENMTEPTETQKAEFNFAKGSITVPAYNLRFTPIWTRDKSSLTVVYWREAEKTDAEGNKQYEYWGSKPYGYDQYTDGSHIINGDITTGDEITPDSTIPNGTTTYKDVPSEISQLTDGSNIDESNYFHYNETQTKEKNTSVIVEGDGTSVLNIYYDRNEYTLKFYYAAKSGNSYNLMGRTNRFGTEATRYVSNANNRNDEIKLFDGAYGDQKKSVSSLPEIKDKERYEFGSDSGSSSRTYYYFTFKAKYGTDISAYWPTTEDIPAISGGNSGRDMVFSAWNGEYNVYYTQHAKDEHNNNETIKGEYRRLDHQLLWDPARNQTNSDNTVTYLAYWCNVSSYDYNYPSLYRYNIYLECLSQHGADTTCDDCEGHSPKTFTTSDGVTKSYYLVSKYDVADNNDTTGNGNLQEQSHPKVNGFVNVNDYNGENFSVETEYNTITLTSDEQESYRNGYEIYHFYDRIRYNLKFNNNGEYLLNVDANGNFTEDLTIRYGVKIGIDETYDLNEIKDENGSLTYYPKNLEADGYEFEGWYTSPTFAKGTEFEFKETDTMPAHDMELYAHWVKKQHEVKVYLSEDDLAGEAETPKYTFEVLHGETAPTPSDPEPTDDGKAFDGWYYIDSEGIEQRFMFSMPIHHDMNIYAKYYNNVAVEYTVAYILADGYEKDENGNYKLDAAGNRIPIPAKDEQGNEIRVAPELVANNLVDTHVTVFAKSGEQLYEPYQTGYFPEPISQDLSLSLNKEENYKTVYYSKRQAVPYSVSYVDENGKPIDETKYPTVEYKDNQYSAVVEDFINIPGYTPDKLQKQLTISADETDSNNNDIPDINEFTFVYKKADTTAVVIQVIEYEQDLYARSTYNEIEGKNQIFDSLNAIIGDGTESNAFQYQIAKRDGFVLDPEWIEVNNNVVGNLSADKWNEEDRLFTYEYTEGGMLIEIYHDRQSIEYTVRHITNSGETLKADEKKSGIYGETVFATSESFRGYQLVDGKTYKEIVLDVPSEYNRQEIVFTYQEENVNYTFTASVNGKAIDTIDWQWLTTYSTNTTSFSDTTTHGSTAQKRTTAPNGTVYNFAGWFYDEACTQPVSSDWLSNESDNVYLTITPKKIDGINVSGNFYAKYEPYLVDLTIATAFSTNQGQYSSLEPNKTFIFRVTGVENTPTADIDLYVTVHGKGSVKIVDLPAGQYTITTNLGWSWRYQTKEKSRTVTLSESGTTETFRPSRENQYWLDGHDYKVNVFGSGNN